MRIGFNRACLVSWLTVFILSSFSSFSSIHPFCSRESCSLPNMTVEIRCHYDVLGVERSADAATIKKAHRKLALKLHPDKNIGDDTAAEQFRLVQQACVWQAQKLGSDVSFLLTNVSSISLADTNAYLILLNGSGTMIIARLYWRGGRQIIEMATI